MCSFKTNRYIDYQTPWLSRWAVLLIEYEERESCAGKTRRDKNGEREGEMAIGGERMRRLNSASSKNGSQICAYKLAGLKVHKVEFIVG